MYKKVAMRLAVSAHLQTLLCPQLRITMFNIRSLLILAVVAFSGVNSTVLPTGSANDVAVRSSGELAIRSNAGTAHGMIFIHCCIN
jgi:hypothetical protein